MFPEVTSEEAERNRKVQEIAHMISGPRSEGSTWTDSARQASSLALAGAIHDRFIATEKPVEDISSSQSLQGIDLDQAKADRALLQEIAQTLDFDQDSGPGMLSRIRLLAMDKKDAVLFQSDLERALSMEFSSHLVDILAKVERLVEEHGQYMNFATARGLRLERVTSHLAIPEDSSSTQILSAIGEISGVESAMEEISELLDIFDDVRNENTQSRLIETVFGLVNEREGTAKRLVKQRTQIRDLQKKNAELEKKMADLIEKKS